MSKARSSASASAPAVSSARCAVYTRKSTDEGLDQAFNSLDAQREAGQAFGLTRADRARAEIEGVAQRGLQTTEHPLPHIDGNPPCGAGWLPVTLQRQ